MSLPLRERGLKHNTRINSGPAKKVAPPAGAWIETKLIQARKSQNPVAPPAGAWIETLILTNIAVPLVLSLPLRERGLKL